MINWDLVVKSYFNTFVEGVTKVLMTLIICVAIVFLVLIICNRRGTNSKIEESRLATQLKIVFDETASSNSSKFNVSSEDRALLATALIKEYDPATDSLAVHFNPDAKFEDNSVNKILDLMSGKLGPTGKAILDKMKIDGKTTTKENW